jgi:hypothetical protein
LECGAAPPLRRSSTPKASVTESLSLIHIFLSSPPTPALKSPDEAPSMNIHDFRRLALSLLGAEESSHMGSPDFRVGGRIFATLAAAKLGYGNIMITPEQQAAFVEDLPEIFIPVPGGWGRGGATHVNLAIANEDVVLGALRIAHKNRVEKNVKTGSKPPVAKTKAKSKPVPTVAAKKSKPARSKHRPKKRQGR